MADCNEKKENQTPEMMKKAEEFLASKRRIFLWGGVDDESAERIVKQLLYLDSLNHEDIVFFINSPGGVISSGLAICDCMNAIQSVYFVTPEFPKKVMFYTRHVCRYGQRGRRN